MPALTAEWHPELNGDRTPHTVTAFSDIHAVWRCTAGHVWSARIAHRSRGAGCPTCSIGNISRIEQALAASLAETLTVQTQVAIPIEGTARPVRADIVLPDLNIVIEYDGWYWHQDTVARDRARYEQLATRGYRLIRLREEPLGLLHRDDMVVPDRITNTSDRETAGRRVATLLLDHLARLELSHTPVQMPRAVSEAPGESATVSLVQTAGHCRVTRA